MTRIVCVSDTHNKLHHFQDRIPEGDLLIHAGDLTGRGERGELERQVRALEEIKSRYTYGVVLTAGNHDFYCQREPALARLMMQEAGLTYLENESAIIAGFNVWGSPMTPEFFRWAFMAKRGPEIDRYWQMIPQDTDILVTHGPPMGWLDEVRHVHGAANIDGDWKEWEEVEHVGCEDLLRAVERVKPRLHVFGHIHGAYARVVHPQGTIIVNASSLDERYQVTHEPIVVDL